MSWRDMLSEKDIANGKYWTEPWGLVNKCDKVSEGCLHCWAETMWKRKHPGEKWSGVICREDKLSIPSRRGKRKVFSVWNDLFHPDVPDDFIEAAIDQMYARECCRHLFLVLTKRAKRMAEFTSRLAVQNGDELVDRIWFGTTAENQPWLDKRYKDLVKVPGNRFLSLEPLLGEIDLSGCCSRIDGPGLISHGGISDFIHWVIVGCETGPGRRPCAFSWIQSVVDQCKEAGVPCWVKAVDLGSRVSHNMDEWPVRLRVRQLPDEHV